MAEPAAHWDEVEEPDLSQVVTEDDEAVDNVFSERQQRLLVDSLYASGQDFHPLLALANVGLFATAEDPPFVPDVLVSLGVLPPQEVWEKRNRSYFIWRYGKPPDLVIEVVSNRDRHEEAKIEGYARLGIAYYAIFDPELRLSQRKLRVYERHGLGFVPVADPRRLTSLPFGLVLETSTYEDLDAEWLRFVDSQGNVLLTGHERAERESQRADQESQRAERESQRADQESQRAERESQRAERERHRAEALADRLRQLGVEPDVL